MTTYADGFNLRTATATLNNIASGLDGLLAAGNFAASSSSISTTSSSVVTTSTSVSVTCNSGEVVYVFAWMNVSKAAAGFVGMSIAQNGTAHATVGPVVYDAVTGTGGLNCQIVDVCRFTPSVGANTYAIYWSNGGSGTAYSAARAIMAVAVQES